MSITIGGVACEFELGADGSARSLSESWGSDGPKIALRYKCDFSKRYTLAQALRGGVVAGTRTTPHACPYSPNLYCLALGEFEYIKPRVDAATGLLIYDQAIVPAEYGVPTWDAFGSAPGTPQSDPSGKAFTETTGKASVEVFQPPSGAYYWQSGPNSGKKVTDSTLGLFRPRTEFTVRRRFLPHVPLAAANLYLGSLNSITLYYGDMAYPPGTVLFATFDFEPNSDSIEGKTFDVTYTLVANGPVSSAGTLITPTWNQFMDTNGQYYAVADAATSGHPPYKVLDYWSNLP